MNGKEVDVVIGLLVLAFCVLVLIVLDVYATTKAFTEGPVWAWGAVAGGTTAALYRIARDQIPVKRRRKP